MADKIYSPKMLKKYESLKKGIRLALKNIVTSQHD